ncbi:MAG: hypothetical protein AAF721_22685 [Myxococcota bacterium]
MTGTTTRRLGVGALGIALGWLSPGCGGDEGGRGSVGTFPGGVSMGPSGATDSMGFGTAGDDEADDGDDDDGGLKLDVQGGGDEAAGDEAGDGACEEIIDEAEVGPRPQDIIVVIDTSGSMSAEAAFVQAQMNSFSIQIEAANVDSRIVLISSNEVCIGAPLGSGACPADTNPPDYLHVQQSVGSSNGLELLVSLYPEYAAHLRPTAVTHVVMVSDDDSSIDAPNFIGQFVALSPHLADFVFHGIIAPEDPFLACTNMTTCCGLAAEQGTVYQALIQATGGVEGNLCEQEFQPIFQAVAQEVIGGASLSCSFEIPPAPAGETFNKDEVNVEFDDGAGGSLEIGRVDSAAACGQVTNGWHYDNPDDPQVIVLCPQTCGEVQGFAQASIGIIFGCATIPAG